MLTSAADLAKPEDPPACALVALGANIASATGGPAETLEAALDALDAEPEVKLGARSRWWRSAAVPAGSGPDFVNGCAVLETALSPAALLDRLHAVEAGLGRTRPARWAPRVCDLDLLAVGERVLPDRETVAHWAALGPEAARRAAPPALLLPHPRMAERAFVLAPLAEIAPAWRHPLSGLTPAEMLAALPAADRDACVPLPETAEGQA